jgi:hypothetical protein
MSMVREWQAKSKMSASDCLAYAGLNVILTPVEKALRKRNMNGERGPQ